jgi:hypothetical protein
MSNKNCKTSPWVFFDMFIPNIEKRFTKTIFEGDSQRLEFSGFRAIYDFLRMKSCCSGSKMPP